MRDYRDDYLKRLAVYCDYHMEKDKVVIDEVFKAKYDKGCPPLIDLWDFLAGNAEKIRYLSAYEIAVAAETYVRCSLFIKQGWCMKW